MIKLLASLLHAFLWDENAARRWLRGIVALLAVSGGFYADQVAALLPPTVATKAATAIRGVALMCAFGVAAHDGRKRKAGAVVKLPTPAPAP